MSNGNQTRTRSERVASLDMRPGGLARMVERLRRGHVMSRILLCLITAMALWLFTRGWSEPFAFREGDIPVRDVVARVDFERVDREGTRKEREHVRQSVPCVYENRVGPVIETRGRLVTNVSELIHAGSFETLNDQQKASWDEFWPEPTESDSDDTSQSASPSEAPDSAGSDVDPREEQFGQFVEVLGNEAQFENFEKAIEQAFVVVEQDGLIERVHSPEQGSQRQIQVYPEGNPSLRHPVEVTNVRIGDGVAALRDRLETELDPLIADPALLAVVTERVHTWLKPKLGTTLYLDEEETREAADLEEQRVEDVMVSYDKGSRIPNPPPDDQVADATVDLVAYAVAGRPLTAKGIELLRLEHRAYLASQGVMARLGRSVATFGMYAALFALCGFFVVLREKGLLRNMRRFALLLTLVTLAVAACCVVDYLDWRAEMVPLALFGMTAAIVFRHELALLLALVVTLVVVVSLGQDLADFITLATGTATAVLLCGRIRSRTRLIYVGLETGGVVLLATLGAGVLAGMPLGTTLLSHAVWNGFCAVLAGVLMTGLLPFVEAIFDVHTDISLLELGDAAHPLLQELLRRAPGTYNHSINVASIGEAAAEAIGANGLLVRVGAYFHDIGKMLKPGYFVENQGEAESRHEQLLPAMSTLVIIAHVKDGADLARQHRLPHDVIDFIQQHHGTTLVQYFFDQAAKRSEADPNAPQADEESYRYPGPRPQTKETAVFMLADSVEGASRTLVDPTPARIERIVHEIAMKRLLDGQFDMCGLTLQELAAVEDSLVKSLTAVYHGRVKYPDQQTA